MDFIIYPLSLLVLLLGIPLGYTLVTDVDILNKVCGVVILTCMAVYVYSIIKITYLVLWCGENFNSVIRNPVFG